MKDLTTEQIQTLDFNLWVQTLERDQKFQEQAKRVVNKNYELSSSNRNYSFKPLKKKLTYKGFRV